MNKQYCEAIYQAKRRSTRVVFVGDVAIGGNNPIRIQSMTTSNTRDAEATADQAIRLVEAGCEIVRLTVQGIKEADACEAIKNLLIKRGYTVPLVADIHFYPPAALRAVDFVEKVRINPGNFADKRAAFKVISYDDLTYAEELLKIEEKFTPLVEKCKRLKRAMRIGTNHGSLSDRIMNRYGDTPAGMVESALEFARICRKLDYHDLVFSMKASNPKIMIQAYRLLSQEMYALGWDYPLHLGVTEAGDGEDGRVKSSMGIGALLLDGIGDTIRISLTEDPWFEIDPCKRLIDLIKKEEGKGIDPFIEKYRSIGQIEKRHVHFGHLAPLHRNGSVFLSATQNQLDNSNFYRNIGCGMTLGKPLLKTMSADAIVLRNCWDCKESLAKLSALQQIGIGVISDEMSNIYLVHLSDVERMKKQEENQKRFSLNPMEMPLKRYALQISDEPQENWESLLHLEPLFIVLSPKENRLHTCRKFFDWLQERSLALPVILHFSYHCSIEDVVLQASMEYGALLCDGLGEGIWLEGPYPLEFIRNLSFSILQAARQRMTKTDFISCPSCGRTLFDLQDVTKRIQSRTSHLPGVKIAIMGCIVNGPGEMADADFGYVGSKPGKIDLYLGKECMERDIDFAFADDRLVALIKAHGRWVEPGKEEIMDKLDIVQF